MPSAPMSMSDAGLAFLINEEGERAEMYKDSAGLPTIGVGHLLTKDELSSGKLTIPPVDWHRGLSPEQIKVLLMHDLGTAMAAVNNVRVELTQHQYDALTSMVFNIGVTAFRNSTLLRVLNQGQYDKVPFQMRRWIHSAGRIDPILVKRREREVVLWLSPD